MGIRVFGVSGSPVCDGNVDSYLSNTLKSIEGPGVTIETASLAKYSIEDCRHCNFCWRKQSEGRYCALNDDGQLLFEKVEAADILVLATPVYFMRTSARMAAFIDRLRVFIFGNITKKRLRNIETPSDCRMSAPASSLPSPFRNDSLFVSPAFRTTYRYRPRWVRFPDARFRATTAFVHVLR